MCSLIFPSAAFVHDKTFQVPPSHSLNFKTLVPSLLKDHQFRRLGESLSLSLQLSANFLKLARQMQSPNSVLAFYHFESPSGL
jgi:hypothetical protein